MGSPLRRKPSSRRLFGSAERQSLCRGLLPSDGRFASFPVGIRVPWAMRERANASPSFRRRRCGAVEIRPPRMGELLPGAEGALAYSHRGIGRERQVLPSR